MKILLFTIFTGLITATLQAQTIRDFSASTIHKETVTYSNIKGDSLTIIDFWASWCKPCLKAMPKLEKVFQEYRNKSVNVIGINVDGPRSVSKARPLVNTLNITYPIIIDMEGNIKNNMEVNSLPTLLIINSKNKIVYRHEGYAPGDEEELKRMIDKLLQ